MQAAVPQDIAQDVSRTTGTDVTTVPVFRGPAVDAAARERGARAFARADAVFLPDAAGPVTTPKARALIAHELVHVAQQRATGRTPDPTTPQGRRMEADAVAVERRYETTTAAGPELHHPPAPVPELAGPAQLATYATAPPDPAHSHFDIPAREEIVQLAESSAHRVVEEWSAPTNGGGGGFRRPSSGSPAPTFDRATRRQELEAEMLDEINADRSATGEPLLSSLEPEHVARLERRLDHEEITGERRGSRSGGGARTPLPPLVGGAFGDTVSFSQTIGGPQAQQTQQTPLQQAMAAQEAQRASTPDRRGATAAASRVGLAAALTGQTDADGRLPATDGGALGDTVSFTERQGADRYPGGRPPTAAPDRQDPGHGSEQEQIDLDRVDLEDLTNRLYDRLRGRLRLELLVDRERAGILTDFR